MRICVYGAASDTIDQIYLQEAYALGQIIGRGGHTLVFGAGNTGVMGACARGVRDTHGRIIGVAPHFFDVPGILFSDCTEMIMPDTMRERKAILEENSDIFVAAPGGIGTLDELFEILTLYTLEQHGKSVCLLNTQGYWGILLTMLDTMVEKNFLRPEYREMLVVLNTLEEAEAFINSRS